MATVRVVGSRVCRCHFGRHGAWPSFPENALRRLGWAPISSICRMQISDSMTKRKDYASEAPYHPVRIQLGSALLGISAALLVAYAMVSKQHWILERLIELLLLESLLVMKWGAPAIPWKQIGACILAVWVLHVVFHCLGEHVSALLYLAADHVIDFVCVFGFGRHWVKCGYIPLSANS